VRPVRLRSGWVTFAAAMIAIAGVWHILSGIAAIAEDDMTEAINEVLFGLDITAWGWFWLVLGALQVLTAWLIFDRQPLGQVLGLVWATLGAALAVFMIFVAPTWALVVLGVNAAVIWALLADVGDFET